MLTMAPAIDGEAPSSRRRHRTRTLAAALAVVLVVAVVIGGAFYKFATHEGGPLANATAPYTGEISSSGPAPR
jgi:hypothetical protein